MSLLVATHHGPFHADDVTAVALVRAFLDPTARLVRTRNAATIEAADVVVDVGAVYDPAARRFDHHQKSYAGDLSSAGMVLEYLESTGRIAARLAARIRDELVTYVDAVDVGRTKPESGRPCLPVLISLLGEQATDHADFDRWFDRGVDFVVDVLRGIEAVQRKEDEAREVVRSALEDAVKHERRVVLLDRPYPWKRAYFELGGETHPTDFVLFPGDGDVRVVAAPPTYGSLAQKTPFPEAWAGLEHEALEAVIGVPGAIFCHKNRFIAVFRTFDAARRALESAGLWQNGTSSQA